MGRGFPADRSIARVGKVDAIRVDRALVRAYTPAPFPAARVSGACGDPRQASGTRRAAGSALSMAHKQLTAQELQKFDDALRQILGVLTGDIARLEDETSGSQAPSGGSAEDSGPAMHSLEISLELLERDEDASDRVLAALARLEQGVFGLCVRCRNPVPRTRLQAIPYAENCIDCQRKLEQHA